MTANAGAMVAQTHSSPPRSDTVTIFDAGERRAARRINRRALLDAGECEGPLLIGDDTSTAYVPPAGVRGSMRITTSF